MILEPSDASTLHQQSTKITNCPISVSSTGEQCFQAISQPNMPLPPPQPPPPLAPAIENLLNVSYLITIE